MKNFFHLGAVVPLLLFALDAPAETVRTVVPRATLNYLSIPVAEVKGFFRDQGLENETVVIPGATARDITRIAIPSRNTTSTIPSLKTGAFSAAVVNADESLLGEKEGLRTLAFVGDLFPFPFQGFMATDKMIAERPGEIKKWLRAMARALMFIRERPEESADIALKKLPMGNMSRPLVVEGIRRFARALPDGVPGLPSAQGIKNLIEFDVKAPLKLKEDVPVEKVMHLRLIREVKEELEARR